MMFLDLFKPSTWLSGVNDGIMGTITTALRTLFYWINTFIYGLIINLYEFFDMMCGARLLDNVAMNEISQRVGLILGLVMFFVIIFSFIKMLIDPDKVTDKEMGAGSIIKKVIIVIVMLGASNFVFQSLYKIQTVIVDGNVISKLILPYEVEDGQMDNFGKILSMQLMGAFYQLEDLDGNTNISYDENDNDVMTKVTSCSSMYNLFMEDIQKNGRFELGYTCLNESIDVTMLNNTSSDPSDQIYLINFNGIFATLAGAVVVYMLFMYCFGVGIRLIQLTFLEIISPMAIISYISPKKDNMFAKWWKLYFATYIDIFIRVGIISFVAFLIMTLFSTNSVDGRFIFWDSFGSITTGQKSFLTVIIVLALLTFAKKAPELIKELFPASASKIGFGMKMKDVVGLQKGFKMGTGILSGTAAGALGGAIGFMAGRPLGLLTGALSGGLSGLKGQGLTKTASSTWKAQTKMNKTIADVKANGGTAFGYHMAQLQKGLGLPTAATEFDLEKADLEAENAVYKSYDSYIDAAEKRAEGQILKGKFGYNDNVKEALKQKNLADIYRQQSANVSRTKYVKGEKGDLQYQAELERYAKLASDADSAYLVAMKEAKKDYISAILKGTETDDPTLQNLQQAAGVVDANADKNYDFIYDVKDSNGNVVTKRLTGADLLAGDYDRLDNTNAHAKAKQTKNNNKLAMNKTKGAGARANAGK